jgi:aspartate/methionine/tyrosine aminotransferase
MQDGGDVSNMGRTGEYSGLVRRVAGAGADAWDTHYQALAARERGEDVVILSVGDPDLDTPAPIVGRAIEALRGGDTHYAPLAGRAPLRAAIAALHHARTGQQVDSAQVIFLSGAQNALFAASLCLVGPGDEVISCEPMYPTYPATIEVGGARLVRVPAAADFRLDLEALGRAVTPRTRALFIATPNNPSGVIASKSDMQVIGDLAQRHSLWVVADEVYAGLAPEGRVPGLAARLPEQVVTISSLSKTHAMTGWRAGWMVGPAALIGHVESLVLSMLFGLPGFVQEASLTALEMARETEAATRAYCEARCEVLLAGLRDAPGLRCHRPDAGMFILVDVEGTGLSGREFVEQLFAAERVSVLDGAMFGEATRRHVRICFAAAPETLREASTRIQRFATGRQERRRTS